MSNVRQIVCSILSIVLLLVGFGGSGSTWALAQSQENVAVELPSTLSFKGFCYGPHRDNEDPDFGIQPTRDELAEDLAFIAKFNSPIRTYGATDNLELIPLLAEEYEIDNYPGAWLSRYPCENERQIENLIHIANQELDHVKGLIVGNEVLLRKDISEDELLEYISRVKSVTDLPITTAEIWKDWLDHPRLVEAVDILFVHIYPFWDGIAVEDGADYILARWNELQAQYPDKVMVIGETGWPSGGDPRGQAVPSPENQRRFILDFVEMTEANNIEYFFFEVFDEKWKVGEGTIGTSWGLYKSNGQLKEHMIDLMPSEVQQGIDRPPRTVLPTEATFPHYVYKDGCSTENHFFTSGWMGELADIVFNDSTVANFVDIIDEQAAENPHSGETSIRISYTPKPNQWGGIYWQFPVNNWGNYPGYDFSASFTETDTLRLSFWARGHDGGEKAEFLTGGIQDPTLDFADSYGPLSTGEITLTKEWKEYSISFTGKSLDSVIGGFAWVTNDKQNPNGATIYLDDIVFTKSGSSPVSAEEAEDEIPYAYRLGHNYPNPFNTKTTITFSVPVISKLTLSVFDVLGRKIATLASDIYPVGNHEVTWDATNFPSGLYIYQLQAPEFIETGQMTILK